MDKTRIAEAFSRFNTDKGPRRHSYHFAYADIFLNVEPTKILEIGVQQGRSIAAWQDLFPKAIVHGVDIKKQDLIYPARDMPVFIGNSLDKRFIDTTLDKDYDIIIDDGDHRPDAQWATFLNLKDSWKKYYVIEDIISEQNEIVLRRRFRSVGIKNVVSYRSAFRGDVQVRGEMVNSAFFIMVVTRE